MILTQENKEHRDCSQVTYDAYRVIVRKSIAKFYTTKTIITVSLYVLGLIKIDYQVLNCDELKEIKSNIFIVCKYLFSHLFLKENF